MIPALLPLLSSTLLGMCLVRLLAPGMHRCPSWLRWVLTASLGFALGAGFASLLFFVLRWLGLASPAVQWGVELAFLFGTGALAFRRPAVTGVPQAPDFRWVWLLRVAAVVLVLIVASSAYQFWSAQPDGEWDAFSIWNLRARFLAGGDVTWKFAVSSDLGTRNMGASHPGYPLLNSAFTARTWLLAGSTNPEVPALISAMFAYAAAGLLAAMVAWTQFESLGLLAVLVLLATDTSSSQVVTQYADVPLSLFLLGAIAWIEISRDRAWHPGALVLAGLCAGFAAWTKNEGLPFLLFTLATIFWKAGGGPFVRFAAGCLPGAMGLAILRFALAPAGESIFPKSAGEALQRLIDPGRWIQIAGAYIKAAWELGPWWAHPLALLVLLLFVFGIRSMEERLPRRWLDIPLLGLLAAELLVYGMTTADLAWHLSTSVNRLILQVWPMCLFLFFLAFRTPDLEPEAAASLRPASTKRKR